MRAGVRVCVAVTVLLAAGIAAPGGPAAGQPLRFSVTPPRVLFGEAMRLRGFLPDGHGGDQVTIVSKPCGFSGKSEIYQVPVRSNGTFVFAAEPMLRTTFSMLWKGVPLAGVDVTVEPVVELLPLPNHRFKVEVTTTGGLSLDARHVTIEHARAGQPPWKPLVTVALKDTSPPAAMTSVASATFAADGALHNDVLRAVLSAAQAAPCYLSGTSNLLRTYT